MKNIQSSLGQSSALSALQVSKMFGCFVISVFKHFFLFNLTPFYFLTSFDNYKLIAFIIASSLRIHDGKMFTDFFKVPACKVLEFCLLSRIEKMLLQASFR